MQGSDLRVVTGSGEWSALYDLSKTDGPLLVVGDHYLIQERIYSLLGVEEVSSDEFLDASQDRSGAASTFTDFLQRVADRTAREEEAAQLEAEAAALTARADQLRAKT